MFAPLNEPFQSTGVGSNKNQAHIALKISLPEGRLDTGDPKQQANQKHHRNTTILNFRQVSLGNQRCQLPRHLRSPVCRVGLDGEFEEQRGSNAQLLPIHNLFRRQLQPFPCEQRARVAFVPKGWEHLKPSVDVLLRLLAFRKVPGRPTWQLSRRGRWNISCNHWSAWNNCHLRTFKIFQSGQALVTKLQPERCPTSWMGVHVRSQIFHHCSNWIKQMHWMHAGAPKQHLALAILARSWQRKANDFGIHLAQVTTMLQNQKQQQLFYFEWSSPCLPLIYTRHLTFYLVQPVHLAL